MRLACLPAAKRLLASLAAAATTAALFAIAPIARAADKQINAVPRALALAPASAASTSTEGALIVGSKRFTESYILGEILRQTAATAGPAEHRQGLGNTAVVLAALKAGAIDVYPEYLGTIDAEILGHRAPASREVIARELAEQGLGLGAALGFANGYALAMPADEAERLHIAKISDLADHPDIVLGLSHEFLGRGDGWPGLSKRYGLTARPLGIDHGLSYDAMASGKIAVTDIYTTDAQIAPRHLRVLADDKDYFPHYDAVLLYRLDAATRHPAQWQALQGLANRIPAAAMIAMNGRAELRHEPFADIAKDFLGGHLDVSAPVADDAHSGHIGQRFLARLLAADLMPLLGQHLLLVAVAVLCATLLGVPLGAAAAAWPRSEGPVMATVGVLQTIPSLALLAMLIPLLGRIGTGPALVALTLYALLPIARNTATGLLGVPAGLREAGTALGLTPAQRWRAVDVRLALPTIMAGIGTAAVITVGTATIAAFVGAGGLGDRIVTGLALNDHAMLLAGAVPAAVLALLVQGLFALTERLATPRSAA
ncbi:glycine betaine ABC transporter substrate-binding protein [Scleromatobacter humisilvae]|uniref:ABC transporter permease subunit n=1 Tax=Scleromatobacter humisilvae TaxID=2897159 RepID=A0A9X1YN61_9BURK|nr:glycine betaine ABC transporter substrate-binding protein [Scleromatobacter humisilvae]MCK9688872.1 ABC transporter permease subunit [Scleromatobacter humisilvae]